VGKIADHAAAAGNTKLAEEATSKLQSIRAAKASTAARATTCVEAGWLDLAIGRCACWATWSAFLAWEQMLVFTTSFGTLLCLALDASFSISTRSLTLASAGSGLPMTAGPLAGTRGRDGRPLLPLLVTFMRIAVSPNHTPPAHWRFGGRFTVIALRLGLFVPVGHFCVTLTVGGLLSLARFIQRCNDVRAVELERASQSHTFLRVLQACNAVIGISSFALFLRLYLDYRAWRAD